MDESNSGGNQFGITTGAPKYEPHPCTTCGETHTAGTTEAGFENMLGRLGLSDEAIGKMRTSLENLDFEGYFNDAKKYLGKQATKARDYTKENKTVVAAAVGAVAVAAGVLIALRLKGDRVIEDDRDRV